AITSSGEFTFEVWANPADLKQWGPARVVSYSWDRHQRNFTLGQQAARAEVRMRTTGGNEDGWPYLREEDAFSENLEHYTVTYANHLLSFYRNGQLVKAEPREGDLSNWNPDYPLLIGNERDEQRSWRGEVYMMAVYSRALVAAEVHRNYLVGDNLAGGGNPVANLAPEVDAGDNQVIALPNLSTSLGGAVADDGLPGPGLTTSWALMSGPGTASFNDPSALGTTVTFSEAGQYQLQLTASDGALATTDEVTVSVSETARVTRGLIAYYPLTETAGAVVHDQSNNGPPLDLEITGDVTWLPGQNGVLIGRKGKLESAPAAKLHQSITGSNAFTFEVWAKAANTTQGGPARLVNYSEDPYHRNFMLGQQKARAEIRLRTTASDDNGKPYLRVEEAFSTLLEHYTTTFDGRMLRLFRNGQLIGEEPREGDLSNWDPSYVFLLGNEHGASRRDWYGEIYLAAVYDRALSAPEVMRNYIVGEDIEQGGMPVPNMPPQISGGSDKTTTMPKDTMTLAGSAIDDGLPIDTLTTAWTTLSGPAPVDFGNAATLHSSARFTADGDYVLRLTVSDGEHTLTDDVAITVIAAYVPRLLDQATWGPTPESLELLRQTGPEQFLERQFNAIPS
ncbi:MAG: hypothetical protein GY953_16315, partial [bacterium]|nr:hypothetical protein [bacterium]